MNIWRRHQEASQQQAILAKLEREGLQFEKWLITLATGTLVLSVTLLQTASVLPASRTSLILSWVLLVASIFFGLLDRLLYILGLSSHPSLREDGSDERWHRYALWSERISWLQILTFFLGILSLLVFAMQHLSTSS